MEWFNADTTLPPDAREVLVFGINSWGEKVKTIGRCYGKGNWNCQYKVPDPRGADDVIEKVFYWTEINNLPKIDLDKYKAEQQIKRKEQAKELQKDPIYQMLELTQRKVISRSLKRYET